MSHAIIFVGEGNIKPHALEYAKGLFCECENNSCLSCRTFESGNHPDTIYVTGTKVDDVREQIIIPMATKPFKYKYKVFIIENADLLTPAAQNALLKTIEEPAPYGVFLFLAENTYNILPTILSRCVIKKVKGEFSENSALQELAEEIFTAVQTADIPQAFFLYRKIEPLDKDALQEFLNLLYILYGKKINEVTKSGLNPPLEWLNAASEITKAKEYLSQNANVQLTIELLFMNLRGAK